MNTTKNTEPLCCSWLLSLLGGGEGQGAVHRLHLSQSGQGPRDPRHRAHPAACRTCRLPASCPTWLSRRCWCAPRALHVIAPWGVLMLSVKRETEAYRVKPSPSLAWLTSSAKSGPCLAHLPGHPSSNKSPPPIPRNLAIPSCLDLGERP